MTRLELMELAEDCSDVVTAMEDDLLQNIAEYLSCGSADMPTAKWKIQMLARLGRLDEANIRTIAEYSGIAADMEEIAMQRAALAAVSEMEEGFSQLAKEGIISGTSVPMEDSTLQAVAMYSKQAEDRLNKVNTVMRYFAKEAAANAVNRTAEIVNKQQHLDALNKAAGKVIAGTESRQTAVRQCIKEMSAKGIPAFVDAAGRQWSPEAYVNMDVRTTCTNVAHEAQFTRMDDYDIDLLETTSHAGARPKCALDQGRIFSRSGKNKKYPSWKASSYGEPDGILGINCGHFFYPYIEGVSTQTYFPYDKEENDKLYKQKQEQRRLEREVRAAKREYSMLKEAGDKEGMSEARELVKQKTAVYKKYCKDNGFKEKPDRLTVEGYRTKAAKMLDKSGGSDIINKAKPIYMFNDNDIPPNARITTERIIDELSTTEIGKKTLKDIENLPERIKLTYAPRANNVRGEQYGDSITIFLSNCTNDKWAARTVIHEITHFKYGIGQSQWAECVCVAQELKHARNRDYLTVSELRTIISAVKEVYPEYNWRKGGVINGRRKSH